MVPGVGTKDDRLTTDQQGATGKSLDAAQGYQQVETRAEGGQGTGKAHHQGGGHDHVARRETA
ncbi:hypothetical protein D3C77_771440 [compost metagenome]